MSELDKKVEINDTTQQMDTLDEPISETLVNLILIKEKRLIENLLQNEMRIISMYDSEY